MKLETSPILGVPFDLIARDAVLDHILAWRSGSASHFIMIANPHSVMLCRRDPAMREAAATVELRIADCGFRIAGGRRQEIESCSARSNHPLPTDRCPPTADR